MINFVFIGDEKDSFIVNNNYKIFYFNPFKYLPGENFGKTSNLDELWRNNDSSYLSMLSAFYKEYENIDVIVTTCINPFHPEWLIKKFPKAIKIYGCIDDPIATYIRTLDSIWAFDGAFYVSPSYDEDLSMDELLSKSGVASYWWPLTSASVTEKHIALIKKSWSSRSKNIIYVGKYYGNKFDRLAEFKKIMKDDFSIYGNWPLIGFAGMLSGPLKILGIGSCKNYNFFPYKIKKITENEKETLYLQHKICLNMHYSEKRETGNLRMYESTFYGMMLLCDKAANNSHETIYKPNIEAVYYDNIEDAIDKARYYSINDHHRETIAKAGFEKYCKEYDYNKCFIDFLNWSSNIQLRHERSIYEKNF